MKIDSQVVVGQITGEYLARGSKLIKYLHQVQEQCKGLKYFQVEKILRGDNFKANRLARATLNKARKSAAMEDLRTMPSPTVGEESLQIGKNMPRWANDIKKYL